MGTVSYEPGKTIQVDAVEMLLNSMQYCGCPLRRGTKLQCGF
jgi:hypothetical protein